MKYKVVYNTAISGGLHLSEEAVKWLEDRGMKLKIESGYVEGLARHHPLLVQCVEVLGEKANGPEKGWTSQAELHVATIKGNLYYIDDHDGAGEEVIDISKMTDASDLIII